MVITRITLSSLNDRLWQIQRELEQLKSIVHTNPKNDAVQHHYPAMLADEELLAECWHSPEDEQAFAYLQ